MILNAALLLAASISAAGTHAGDRVSQGPPAALAPAPAVSAPYCSGEYADDLLALSTQARAQDLRQRPFTYCVRTTATYECPSYGPDGALRRTRRQVVAHGTAFGLRQDQGDTLLVTNEHVSEWPEVTDEEHTVENVPSGCRRIAAGLRVVDDESDAYDRDDVPASRVVTDPELDVSILRAKAPLDTLPWKIGKSGALRERNVVDVRGFPLGALRAHNVGKVISTGRHDEDNGWDHDDFVVDALLSPGNSGSPVLAVSCETGEFELVGIYHARYTRGSALHTVVGIDQVRDLLSTLTRAPRALAKSPVSGPAADRERVAADARATTQSFFPFGPVTASVRARDDGALLFEVLSRDFPVQASPAIALEDLPPRDPARFGELGRVWAGNRQGLREVTGGVKASPDVWSRLLDALRRDALLAVQYRAQARSGAASRDQFLEARKLERALRRSAASHQDLAQASLEAAEALFPRSGDAELGLAEVLAIGKAPAAPPWQPPELAPIAPGPPVVREAAPAVVPTARR